MKMFSKKNIALPAVSTMIFLILLLVSCASVNNETVKKYNSSYEGAIRSRIFCMENLPDHTPWNIVSMEQMGKELASSKVVIFSDVHGSKKQKEYMIELLERMGTDYIVGMELFHTDHNKSLKRYIQGSIDEEELYRSIGYTFIMELYKPFGYHEMLACLKENKIKTIGLQEPMKKRLANFLQKMAEEGKRPPYDIPDGLTRQDVEMGLNFHKRDSYIVNLVGKFLRKAAPEQTFVIVIGAGHGYEDHLPKLIKERYGIRPVVVEWNLSTLKMIWGEMFIDNSFYIVLKRLGLHEGNALRIGDGFFINFEWDRKNIKRYVDIVEKSRLDEM